MVTAPAAGGGFAPRTSFYAATREAWRELLRLVDNATTRCWVSVAFFVQEFEFCDGSGGKPRGFFALLQAAAERGVNVRVIFWSATFEGKGGGVETSVFADTPEHRAVCAERMPGVRVLFDPSPSRVHCHHTKSFVVDDTSMIGGINLELQPEFPTSTGEGWLPARWDNYLRIDDEAACHAHRQFFAARWNCSPGFNAGRGDVALSAADAAADRGTPWPADLAAAARTAADSVRLLANVPVGHYSRPGGAAAAGGSATTMDLSDGRAEIVEWYLETVGRAQQAVLIESTHFGHAPILRALLAAAERGVRVVYTHGPVHAPVVRREIAKFRQLYAAAGGTEAAVLAHGEAGRYTGVWWLGLALARHPNFTTLCVCDAGLPSGDAVAAIRKANGLPAMPTLAGGNTPLMLHSKLTVVDSRHFTTGSANHVDISLERTPDCGHTELNVGVSGVAATEQVRRATCCRTV